MLGLTPPIDAHPYLILHPENKAKILLVSKVSKFLDKPFQFDNIDSLLSLDKTKLLYYVNKLTIVYCLCISPSVAPDIFTIAYRKGHLGFFFYFKIITRFWFFRRLTKLLWTFVCHYPQCLALETR